MQYFTNLIYILLVGMSFILISKLFIGAKESKLFRLVSFTGLFGILPILFKVINLFFDNSIFILLTSLSISMLSLLVYALWETTFNQINRNQYALLVMALSVFTIVISIMFHYKFIDLNIFDVLIKYNVTSNFIISLTAFKFKEFSNQNKTNELNFIPYILLINVLSNLASIITINYMSDLFTMLNGLSIVLVLYVYYLDYKNSFYY